jgi:AraC-like DNA-binding protein
LQVSTDHGTAELKEPGSACVVSPTDHFTGRYTAGTQKLFVRMPVPTVEQAFGQLTGEDVGGDIVFDPPAGPEATWASAFRLAVRTVDNLDSGFAMPPRIGAELERMFVSSLLLAQPHSASDQFAQRSTGRAPQAVAKIARAVRAAPEEDIDFAHMARANGISLRTLQDGFRNRYGRPPSAFLRDARLDMAHRLLASGQEISVTDAAMSSGFTHLGRFARDYRLRYGFSPSVTRERTRARRTVYAHAV